MTTDKSGSIGKIRIEVYKITNRLKTKLGLRAPSEEPGELAPEKIRECDAMIMSMCADCYERIGMTLDILTKLWNHMRDMPQSDERTKIAEDIFTHAHEIKDIGALCGYTLSAHFAESLRDYIAQTELNLKNQRIIIQAHVDALHVVHKQKLKEDGGAAAEELKRMVGIAIQKYH